MSPVPRSESMRATRAALLAAGLAEIDGHGLDASLDSICARAGVTRGAFYVHFADREAFVVAVMEHVLGAFVTSLGEIARGEGGVAQMLAGYIAAAAARAPVISGGTGLRVQHLLDACRRSHKVGDTYRAILGAARERLAGALQLEQQAGRVRGDLAPRELADVMVVLALGIPVVIELGLAVDVTALGASVLRVIARPPDRRALRASPRRGRQRRRGSGGS